MSEVGERAAALRRQRPDGGGPSAFPALLAARGSRLTRPRMAGIPLRGLPMLGTRTTALGVSPYGDPQPRASALLGATHGAQPAPRCGSWHGGDASTRIRGRCAAGSGANLRWRAAQRSEGESDAKRRTGEKASWVAAVQAAEPKPSQPPSRSEQRSAVGPQGRPPQSERTGLPLTARGLARAKNGRKGTS